MKLLIFDATDHPPRPLLRELGAHKEIVLTLTGDLDVFAAALAQRNHDACLVLIRTEPSADLAELLSKARSLPPPGVVSLISSPSSGGIRAMLALGSRQVFVEPVEPHRVLQALQSRLHSAGPTVPSGIFDEVDPVPCELRSLARVGRLRADRPGELFVETDLALDTGAEVVLVGEMIAQLGLERASFRVVGKDRSGLYYGYPQGYWLADSSEPGVARGWSALIRSGGFARPRTPVLWISDRRPGEIARWLPPNGSSLHPCRPSQLHAVLLARLDPAVVVLDHSAKSARETLAHWAATAPDRRILQTARAGADGWPLLALDDGTADRWTEIVGPLPTPDPAILYPKRSSPLSRCAIAMPGSLLAIAPWGFEVDAPVRTHEDSLLEVVGCDLAHSRSAGLFGRVLRVDGGHAPRLRCELVPLGDDPQLSLVRGLRETHPSAHRLSIEPPPKPTRRFEPVPLVGGVLVALAAAGLGWAATHRAAPPPEGKPASTRAVLEAIRDALD